MPKIVAAARSASIILIVYCLVPCLPALGAVLQARSEDGDSVGRRGPVRSTTRAPDTPLGLVPSPLAHRRPDLHGVTRP